jgi:2-amino-4-hydroxy-6-hydroxymethyldihydropteridine diphosphokinase
MPEVFVGAGSNADPKRRLRFARAELTRRFGAVRCSSVYGSHALGVPAADYSNLVMAFDTDRGVDAVREELRAIESLAGRSRADAAVCELDLDLLLYGRRVDAERRLPRPQLLAAPFVVVPLAELAPQLPHPVTGELPADAAAAVDGNDLARDVWRVTDEE